jgi:hypothetical protein
METLRSQKKRRIMDLAGIRGVARLAVDRVVMAVIVMSATGADG